MGVAADDASPHPRFFLYDSSAVLAGLEHKRGILSQTVLLPSFFPSFSHTPLSFPSPFLCYTARRIRILPPVSLSANAESICRRRVVVQVVLLLNTFPCDSPVVSKFHSLPCFTLFVLLIFYPPNHLSSSYRVLDW